MSFCRRSNQGFGERQTSAAGRWLQDDVDILRSTEPMREMDVPGAFRETGHVIAVGAQLFRNGRMRNDDAWNCGSVIRPNENGRWASGISTIVDRYTKETNTDWMMRMVTGIKEADVCAMERAVREQKLAIVGSTGHRAVIGMRKRKLSNAIIRFRESTKQNGIWDIVEVDSFGCRERGHLVSNGNGDGVNSGNLEACLEVQLVGGGGAK